MMTARLICAFRRWLLQTNYICSDGADWKGTDFACQLWKSGEQLKLWKTPADNRLCPPKTKPGITRDNPDIWKADKLSFSCAALKTKLLFIWKMSQHIRAENQESEQKTSSSTDWLITHVSVEWEWWLAFCFSCRLTESEHLPFQHCIWLFKPIHPSVLHSPLSPLSAFFVCFFWNRTLLSTKQVEPLIHI